MTSTTGASQPTELSELPYVPLQTWHGDSPTGGNSLTQDLNVYYEVRQWISRSLIIGFRGLTCLHPVWRYRVDTNRDRPCPAHDSGRGILLLRVSSKEISSVPVVAFCDGSRGRVLPMVLLGLLPCLLTQRWEVHRSS